MSPAEWRCHATTQPWLRALLLVGAGAIYGVAAREGWARDRMRRARRS
jgi:hypothetical protein